MFIKDEAGFRAKWEVSSEELCILESWLSPMSKNSVLEQLRKQPIHIRDVHGNGNPNGNGNPMEIP